jgi:hypothetical protein
MPEIAAKCIASWKEHLPEYELRLWNEDTFDVDSVPYVKEAYQERKFAFVTDYVRLYAIHHFGGVYMDTDVEVLKNLDGFLALPAFSGFESEREIPTGIMASEQFGQWAGEQLEYYNGRHFRRPDGSLDMTTNVEIISGIMAANGFELNNRFQVYRNCMHMFPRDHFCPKSRSGVITLTANSYCIHHFEGSWQPKRIRLKKFLFSKILGPALTDFLIQTKKKLYS